MSGNVGNRADTTVGLFHTAIAADPTRPVLTYYDDATGERTELSGTTLDNWVAKTANMIVDGGGMAPGDRAAVVLPPHYQTAAVLLGCWTAGLTVDATVAGADISFTTVDGGGDYVLGFAPMAMPLPAGPPPDTMDYAAEVRGFGDHYSGPRPGADDQATPAESHQNLCARAFARTAEWGLGRGARVLIDAARYTDPVDWLLAPLAAGGSIVLCGHMNDAALKARADAERATVILS